MVHRLAEINLQPLKQLVQPIRRAHGNLDQQEREQLCVARGPPLPTGHLSEFDRQAHLPFVHELC